MTKEEIIKEILKHPYRNFPNMYLISYGEGIKRKWDINKMEKSDNLFLHDALRSLQLNKQ